MTDSTFNAAQSTVDQQLEEAGKGAIAIRNELDRVRADRDYQADLAERWKAQFDSAAAAASEYSEFWEQHHGEFDQFGNYVPYSQMDGDLRAAKQRIAELEAASHERCSAATGDAVQMSKATAEWIISQALWRMYEHGKHSRAASAQCEVQHVTNLINGIVTLNEPQTEPMTDSDLRRLWREAGGDFHGPKVEHGSMPETKLLPFLRSLALSRPLLLRDEGDKA